MLQALTNPTQSKMNNKFQAILASIFIGLISAMGCSPAYYPGSASYTVGTSITQSVATLNPLVWTSCAIGGGDCLTGWKKTGGVATTDTSVACSVSTAAHLQLKYYCYIQKNDCLSPLHFLTLIQIVLAEFRLHHSPPLFLHVLTLH